MYCYIQIHWSVTLFKIHIWFFKIQCISHLKNIGSVSYADILNIDTFLYSKKKTHSLISPLTYQRSQGLGNCQDHGSGCKFFRIIVWKFKFYYWSWQDQHSSVAQSYPTLCDPMDCKEHTRPPYPSPTPRVDSNSCPLSWWCPPTILSSVVPFPSHLQSYPASESFQMSQLFASGGWSIGVSASASVLPMNI